MCLCLSTIHKGCPKGVQGAKRNSGNGPLGKGVERDNQHEVALS